MDRFLVGQGGRGCLHSLGDAALQVLTAGRRISDAFATALA
jgi:hypothetical protein